MNSVIHLFNPARAMKKSSFPGMIRRFGSGDAKRALGRPCREVGTDPHLLLLVADQELAEGREEQARYLVEAAYKLFDRKTKSNVHQLFLAG